MSEEKQEILNTLAMVENELCFGGNWEDAKARIARCRSRIAEPQQPEQEVPKASSKLMGILKDASEVTGIWDGFQMEPSDTKLRDEVIAKMSLITFIGTPRASQEFVADQVIALCEKETKGQALKEKECDHVFKRTELYERECMDCGLKQVKAIPLDSPWEALKEK